DRLLSRHFVWKYREWDAGADAGTAGACQHPAGLAHGADHAGAGLLVLPAPQRPVRRGDLIGSCLKGRAVWRGEAPPILPSRSCDGGFAAVTRPRKGVFCYFVTK